jgi:hypothetical protein
MKRADDFSEKDHNMKRRIISLISAFIFIAAAFSTAQPKVQESYLQKCRTRCGDEYRICLKRAEQAGNNERDKQRCHYYNRKCLTKCKPQASQGE